MGSAVWLYAWLILRQTHQHGPIGFVLGGAPITYREIQQETGFNPRTLERWMQTLREHGYVQTETVPAGIVVRITKAKKFPQGARNSADGVRKFAGSGSQSRVAHHGQSDSGQELAAGIRSSSIERSQERANSTQTRQDFHRQLQNLTNKIRTAQPNPSRSGERQNQTNDLPASPHDGSLQPPTDPYAQLRLLRQLLRSERDEEVRRELAVGTGPEVRRS